MDLSARTSGTKISFLIQIFCLGALPANSWQLLSLLLRFLCSWRWLCREGADTLSSQSGHQKQIFRAGLDALPATAWQLLSLLLRFVCSSRWGCKEGADTLSPQSGHQRQSEAFSFLPSCTFCKCPSRLASFNRVEGNLPEGRKGQRGQNTISTTPFWTSCQLVP